jgi:hypothetical protein
LLLPLFGDRRILENQIDLLHKWYGMKKQAIIILTLLSTVYTSCKKQTETGTPALVYAANGDITAKIDAFRNRLGALNTTLGMTSGRREVNWDGVPDALTGMKLPGDFFNPSVDCYMQD